MVVIRLSRGGVKKAPFYNIVVADKRHRRDGRFIERVGYFNPTARGKTTRLEMNKERIEHWVSQGAQPSERVSHLFKAFLKQDESVLNAAPSIKEQKIAQQKASKTAAKKKLDAEKQAAAKTEDKPAATEKTPEAKPETEAKATSTKEVKEAKANKEAPEKPTE